MVNFLKLVQNENMKIYRRLRTWIMLGAIVLIPIIISIIWKLTTDGPDPSNWYATNQEFGFVLMLITIFTVVQSAESVAGEFTWGTIKLLLIRPWSRSVILLSKYLSLILFALFFTVVAFAITLLANIAIFGYTDNPGDYLARFSMGGQLAVDLSPWTLMLEDIGLQLVSLVMIVSFAFMLSSAFRSGGLAIGLSIFLLFAGSIITAILAATNGAWVKYVLFIHLDLSSYLNGGDGPIPNHPMTMSFSLAVLAVYFIIFNLVSWTVFVKRDVAA